MSEKLREALSAAVDGEASEFELRRVFDELAKDDGLAQAWRSYHLIKQAAHGENVQDVSAMSERIWASLDAEEFLEQDIVQEEPSAVAAASPPRRGFQLAGGALAAALALGVFLSGGFLDDSGPKDNPGSADLLVDNNDLTPTPDFYVDSHSGVDVGVDAGAQTVGLDTTSNLQASAGGPANDINNGIGELGEDYDYGPGVVPYDELSAADQARSDGYFLHHVQHQAVNNDSVLSFVKFVSYQK